MKRILFQGDSITDAGRSREDDKHLGIGYPRFVSGELALDNPGEYVLKMMDEFPADREALAGKRIAVTVGSRGIPFLPDMVKAIIDTLKAWGAKPFIVPSMGSHGGANAKGQLEVLESLGIKAKTFSNKDFL